MQTENKPEPRTIRQNRALHVYFQLIADALNNAGLDVQEVIKYQMDVPWSKQRVKDLIWRQAQRAYLGKESTTELNKQKDIDAVYEIVNRFLAKPEIGIHEDFPSIEEIMIKQLSK